MIIYPDVLIFKWLILFLLDFQPWSSSQCEVWLKFRHFWQKDRFEEMHWRVFNSLQKSHFLCEIQTHWLSGPVHALLTLPKLIEVASSPRMWLDLSLTIYFPVCVWKNHKNKRGLRSSLIFGAFKHVTRGETSQVVTGPTSSWTLPFYRRSLVQSPHSKSPTSCC